MSFIPIYIIEMPGSKRVELIKSQLRSLDLQFISQEAIAGKNLADSEIEALVDLKSCDARLGHRISPNLIGSGLSHREVYKKGLKSEFDWILILEEDVILKKFNTDIIEKAMNIAGNHPTIIQLFTRATRLVKTPPIYIHQNKDFIFEFNKRIVGSGAPAYLINREAISLALGVSKLDGAPDWPPWAQKVKMFCIYPWIFNESNEGSTVSGLMRISRRKYLSRRFIQLLGIHYLKYHNQYAGLRSYLNEEIVPYFLYLFWKINKSKYFLNDSNGPQIY
jgi:GR25 family glycosyltransferase involved in LPS biosynthesis